MEGKIILCKGLKKDGGQCKREPVINGYCITHYRIEILKQSEKRVRENKNNRLRIRKKGYVYDLV